MSIKRIEALEQWQNEMTREFAEFKTAIANVTSTFDGLKATQAEISTQLSEIKTFVGGYNTVAGLAKKHWKTILIFGAGVMSSAGVGNPKVWDFITNFAGG